MSVPLSTDQHARDELRRLAGAATPGPWQECGHARGGCRCGNVWSVPSDGPVATAFLEDDSAGISVPLEVMQANAAFIAACDPQTVAALLARLDELEVALGGMLHHGLEEDDRAWIAANPSGVDEAARVLGITAQSIRALAGEGRGE